MKTIKDNKHGELVISKSKFIALLYKVDNSSDISTILNDVKIKYKDATHYCYGYIIDGIKKCSDDGEPSGTAGLPILSTLEAHNLNLVLCIVVRYFGGVKLGVGGLIRAYRKSCSECIKKSNIVKLINAKLIELSFKYEDTKYIDSLLINSVIINKAYNDNIKYTAIVSNETLLKLKDYKIIKDTYIEI